LIVTIEGDKPAINAKLQSKLTITISLMVLPLGSNSTGFNTNCKSNKRIPICKPETARI